MNWYMEIELRHGTVEWDVMKEGFMLTFSFEDGFECIDEALHEIKVAIFRILKELLHGYNLIGARSYAIHSNTTM